ncbi:MULTISPECIES: hypothetical protein [unclassified Mesorhizobium]|uniref:hypothetical protein n=1 Tax=unclassified Mesorhizobium TaxID=325217 RepID=UPI002415B140|nr:MULTISPECIES: hypothetical protein [unclassified Mesorhizobium]MDG4901422.1 hypothetical protein [Mesorhizobium sp. WSM4962]MDG4918910.1 hypothetical protein [Mesorhizobium sp. WSM4989]
MLIGIGPDLRIVDGQGNRQPFPTAAAFSYFFHEFAHYLHNISTVSGIAAFINTIELWRCFRSTVGAAGHGEGSAQLGHEHQDHLRRLMAYLIAARRNHTPTLSEIYSPQSLVVSTVRAETEVGGAGENLLTTLVCDAKVADRGGQAETLSIHLGTLELLEGAAWLLEKRTVSAVNPQEIASPPPIFPYHVAQAVAEYAAPGLSEDGVLACILASLQSSDAPAAFQETLAIARQAVQKGQDPVLTLRARAQVVIKENEQQLRSAFGALEKEFSGNGIMAVTVRQIIDTARLGFSKRRADPFFELEIIRKLGDRSLSIDALLSEMPCAVLQRNNGHPDQVGRDFLLSFRPNAETATADPESGLRVIHSIFDYINRHRRTDGLLPTREARTGPCPFYTCCALPLRQDQPAICEKTPWEAVDWPRWDEKAGGCWYATGVRITRPPT